MLNEVMELNVEVVLKFILWGMCQVMGFNYELCRYKDVFVFVEVMKCGLFGQLQVFVGYCKGWLGMILVLCCKDFVVMVFVYNGKDYGNYDK